MHPSVVLPKQKNFTAKTGEIDKQINSIIVSNKTE
jgi:hypothetical protein